MTTVRDLVKTYEGRNDDSDINFAQAIANYGPYLWDLEVTRERFPLDALVFAGWQQPYTSIEMYRRMRCKYDPETNLWLEHYVARMAQNVDHLPPVLLRIASNGVSLVDGLHRTSALLMLTNEIRIDAWVVQ